MGRIPLLLPLNVKATEAAGQTPERTGRLSITCGVNSRRASNTYGASDAGSSFIVGVSRSKEVRPFVTSGSEVFSISGADRGARPDAGQLAARPSAAPQPHAFTPPSSISFNGSPFSPDGSISSRIVCSYRPAAPLSGPIPVPATTSASGNINGNRAIHDGSTTPLRTVAACPLRSGQDTAASTAAVVAHYNAAGGGGGGTGGTTGAAGYDAGGRVSTPSGGMSLAQLALSSCSTAERQLRELLVERTSPGTPPSTATARTAASRVAAGAAAGTAGCIAATSPPHTLSSPSPPAAGAAALAPPSATTLPQQRRLTVVAVAAVQASSDAEGLLSVVSPAAAPPLWRQRGQSLMLPLDTNRLGASLCSSPITSPIASVPGSGAATTGYVPTSVTDAGAAVGASAAAASGGLVAVLSEHRRLQQQQTLPHAHSFGGNRLEQRAIRFAAGCPDPQHSGAGGGGGPGGGLLGEAATRATGEGFEKGAVGVGFGVDGGCSGSGPASPLHPPQHKLAEEEEASKPKLRAGPMWAALKPSGGAGGGSGSAAAAAVAALGASSQSAAAVALRAVAELQARDEYSLVAAARHRQQVLAQRTQPRQSTSWRVTAADGAGANSAGRPLNGLRRSLGDMPSLVAAVSAAAAGSGCSGGHEEQISLPRLLAARTSCPEMGSELDAVQLMMVTMAAVTTKPGDGGGTAAATAVGSGEGGGFQNGGHTGSPPVDVFVRPPFAPSGGGGGGGAAAEAAAVEAMAASLAATAATGGGGGGSGSFLPAVPSPRMQMGAVSFRSRASSSGHVSVSTATTGSTASGGQQLQRQPLAELAAEAAEAEAALAAVRALAARFGSTVLPDSHAWDQDDPDPAVRERRQKLYEALAAANPAAYLEEAAAEAEAAYRALSERAQLRLRKLLQEPTTQEAPHRQLEDALRDLTSQRPFFLPPVIAKQKVERRTVEANNHHLIKAWHVEASSFAQRKRETESHEVYDTDKVKQQQLNIDWKRVVSKTRFRRMVSKGDSGVKEDGQRLEEELAEVREEVMRRGDLIRAAFVYYSMTAPGAGATSSDALQMTPGAWIAFCHDAGIVGKGLTSMDVQNIFVAVNFEEESETEEAAANDDDAMVRFEFVEGLVRAAFAKYINTKRITDASDALGALLEEVMSSATLPPEARLDPNDFRRNRLYDPDVEDVLKEYWDLLLGMFKLYKARDRARYFWLEHWMSFLESNALLGPATGLTRREAKLVFAWSQALVTDELRRRQRAVSLTLWDFVEAVARLADFISHPDPQHMLALFKAEGKEPPEPERLSYEYYKALGDAAPLHRRPSAGALSPPTRPLAPKLRSLLQYLVCCLREAWGGGDMRDVAAKVMRTAVFLSGGIEMG